MSTPRERESSPHAREDDEFEMTHDAKPDSQHLDAKTAIKDYEAELEASGQGLTGYEGLSQWQTAKKLWVPALYAFAMTFSSVCDGYQVATGGSMVANLGFAQRFGTGRNAAGEIFLESHTLANWGLAFGLCQTLGQFTIGP
jgi:hypothetical protein